jgi:hypothetical protein
MPELDPFDIRLQHAVQAFADRADTRVDAVVVAERAMRRRRRGAWVVLGRAVPVPIVLLAAPVLLLVFLGWSLSGGGPLPIRVWLAPVPTPGAMPTPSPTLLPSPAPTVEPLAPAFVSGTGTSTQVAPTASPPGQGNLPSVTGAVIEVATVTSDPRTAGTGTFRLDVDAGSGQMLGFVSGTLRLDAARGAWQGPCTGASWSGLTPFYDGVAGANVSCWLTGSGAYNGLTFYLDYRFAGWESPDELLGIIAPANPPSQ